MADKPIRIILDTNLLISFLISRNYTRLDDIIFQKQCTLIFSNELLEEFLEVTKRPKFRRFFPQTAVEELIELFDEYAVFVNTNTKVKACRDPKDNFLLSLAIDGKANFLLTGDEDLLVLEKYGDTVISTISDFLKKTDNPL
jgi:putative PIN family toxin of toxin-antitoxin system